jgi:hypothetical protein
MGIKVAVTVDTMVVIKDITAITATMDIMGTMIIMGITDTTAVITDTTVIIMGTMAGTITDTTAGIMGITAGTTMDTTLHTTRGTIGVPHTAGGGSISASRSGLTRGRLS